MSSASWRSTPGLDIRMSSERFHRRDWNQLAFMKPYQTFNLWWTLCFIYPTTISRQPLTPHIVWKSGLICKWDTYTSRSHRPPRTQSLCPLRVRDSIQQQQKHVQKGREFNRQVHFLHNKHVIKSLISDFKVSENLSFPNAVFKELSLGFRNSSQKDGCEAPYLNCQPLHPIRLLDFRPFQPTRHESRAEQPENLLQKCWAKHLKIRQVSIGLPLNNPQKTPGQSNSASPAVQCLTSLNLIPIPASHATPGPSVGLLEDFAVPTPTAGFGGFEVFLYIFVVCPQIFGRKKRTEEMFIYLLISSMCLRFAF